MFFNLRCRLPVTAVAALLLLVWTVPLFAQEQEPPPQIQWLSGHEGSIYATGSSRDGRTLISAGADGTMRLWDRETGELIRTIQVGNSPVLELAVSPDGYQVATGSRDSQVRIFDLAGRHLLKEMAGIGGVPTAISAFGDGVRIVTGDENRLVRILSTANGQPAGDYGGMTAPISALATVPLPEMIIAAGQDGTLRGWPYGNGTPQWLAYSTEQKALAVQPVQPELNEEGQPVPPAGRLIAGAGTDGLLRLFHWPPVPPASLPNHGNDVTSVELSPDGSLIVSGSIDQQVRLHDATTNAVKLSLTGLASPVYSTSFSPDGSMVAASGANGAVQFWETEKGEARSQVVGHTGIVHQVTFHPTQPQVATAGADGTVRLWTLPQGITPLAGHSGAVQVVAAGTDGKIAATAGADKTIRIWDLTENKITSTVQNLEQPATALSLSPDGKLVASGDATGRLFLASTADGSRKESVLAHTGQISGIRWLPENGGLVTTGADGSLRFWKLPMAAPGSLVEQPQIAQAAGVSPDGKTIYLGGTDGAVRVLEAATGKLTQTIEPATPPAAVTAMAVSPDGTLLAAADASGRMRFWKTEGLEEFTSLSGHTGIIHDIRFSADGAYLATAGADSTIRTWKTPAAAGEFIKQEKAVTSLASGGAGTPVLSTSTNGTMTLRSSASPDAKPLSQLVAKDVAINCSAMSADGKLAAVGLADGGIELLDPATGKTTGWLGIHAGGVTGLAFDAKAGTLASVGADGTLRLWKLPAVAGETLAGVDEPVAALAATADGSRQFVATGKTIQVLQAKALKSLGAELPAAATALTASADGKLLAAGTAESTLVLRDSTTGEDRLQVGTGQTAIAGVALHPQATQAATVGSDGTVRIWDVPAAPVAPLAGHSKAITALAKSPNGQLLATASADGTIRLRNVADGKDVRTLSGHTGPVTAIGWRNDSAQLISASADGSVRLWTTGDGKNTATIEKPGGTVSSVAVLPGGTRIATGLDDGKIILRTTATPDEEPLTITAHQKPVVRLALLPDGNTLFSAGADGAVKSWATADGKAGFTASAGTAATDLAISPDAKLLAVSTTGKTIRLFNAADGKPTGDPVVLPAGVSSVSFSPQNDRVAALCGNGQLTVLEIAGNRLLERHQLPAELAGHVVFGADARSLYAAGTAQTVQPVKLALAQLIEASTMPLNAVAFNPAGSQVVAGGVEKNISLWTVANGAAGWKATGHTDAVTSLAYSADGSKVFSGSQDKTARIWSAANGQAAGELVHEAAVLAVSASATPDRLATATSEFGSSVWDIVTGLRLQRVIAHKGAVHAVLLSADGNTMLTGGLDGQLRTEPVTATLAVAAHEGEGRAVVFTADGSQVITAGADKLVKQFDLTGKPVRQLAGFEAPATTLSLRPDGVELLGGCENGRICQWTVANGQLVRALETASPVTGTAWTADGKRMLAASADGNLRSYQAADGQLLEIQPLGEAATALLVPAEGNQFLTGTASGAVRSGQLSLQQLLPGHTGAVNRVAFHPDGASVFSAGADKTIRQWNLMTGQQLGTYGGHTDAVIGLAVTGDGMQVLAASRDKTLRGWNAANRQPAFTITHAVPFRDLDLDPQSGRIVTTGDDRVVRLWDPAAQRELERFEGHADQVHRVAMLPGGGGAVSAGNDKKAGIWTTSATRVLAADTVRVHALKLLPDGSGILTTGDDRLVRLWDLEGKEVRQFSGANAAVRDVAVSADGTLIAGGGDPLSAQKNVYLWNAADGKLNTTIVTPAAVTSVAFSGTETVAVTGADQQVRLYSAADGSLLEQVAFPAVITSVDSLSDTGTFLAGGANNVVYRFGRSLLRKWEGHPGGTTQLAFTPDGSRLISAGADKLIKVWNPADGSAICQITGQTIAATSLAVTDDGRFLFTAAGDPQVRQYDLQNIAQGKDLAPAASFEHAAAVRSVTATADGSRLIVGGTDNQIHIWQTATGKLLERLAGHTSHVTTLDASPDGTRVLSGSLDDTLRSWTPTVVAAVPAHGESVLDVAFSASGKSVYSVGTDNVVRQFQVPDLAPGPELAGAEGTLNTLAVSRDGAFVAGAGSDGSIRLWNAADGKLVLTHKLPETTATDVVLGDDGTRITVLCADQIVRVFSLQQKQGEAAELVQIQESIAHPEGAVALTRGDDERFVYSLGTDRKVRSWLSSEFGPRQVFAGHEQPVYQLSWRPDGTQLASAGGDGAIRLWDIATGEVAFSCEGHTSPVTGLSFSANGQELASSGRDGIIRLWNCVPPPEPAEGEAEEKKEPKEGEEEAVPPPKLGAEVARLETGTDARVTSLLYARGRNEVFAGLSDGQFLVFNRADGTQTEPRVAHNAAIYQMAYNPALSRIATIDLAGQLVIWNASNQSMIYHQALPLTTGWTLEYTADGTELIIGGNDERVLRLIVPPPVR